MARAAFQKHAKETRGQIARLQQVFELIDKPPRDKTGDVMDGIVADGEEIMAGFQSRPALDACLISSAQDMEHYEITRCGALKRWATGLGMTDASQLPDESLKEETRTDSDLNKLADMSASERAKGRKAAFSFAASFHTIRKAPFVGVFRRFHRRPALVNRR